MTLRMLIYTSIILVTVSCSSEITEVVSREFISSIEEIDTISEDEIKSYWGNNDTANVYINHDLKVYRLDYNSVDLSGNETILSGAILIPQTKEIKGIISMQHATFFADVEAPSINGDFSVVSRKSIFASNGYIVVLPDYIGYGSTSGQIHPYHHAASLASASSDMIPASIEFLKEKGISYGGKIFLAGYSEGAFATAAMQQENRLLDNYSITGISIGSGAYNLLETVLSFTDLRDQDLDCLACNAFLVQSYDQIYDFGRPMSYYFKQPYADRIEDGLFLGAYDATQIERMLPESPADLYTELFIEDLKSDNREWRNALQENSLTSWDIAVPTLLTHNLEDQVAPFFNSADLFDRNRGTGLVEFIPIEGTNHFNGIFNWGILTMEYFNRL